MECYSTLSELQCAVASEFGRLWICLKCSFKDGLLSIDLDVILVKDEYECDYDPIELCAYMDHVISVNIIWEYICMIETMMVITRHLFYSNYYLNYEEISK